MAKDKVYSEDEIAEMERTVQGHRGAQEAARTRDHATRLLAEKGKVQPLVDFVGSEQYKGFVDTATELTRSLAGQPLIQHLLGALTSLDVVSMQVGEAKNAYGEAETALAALDQPPEEGPAVKGEDA